MSRHSTAKDYAAKTVPNPCNGCTTRHAACHGSCGEYLAYREKFQTACNEMYQEQKRQCLPDDFAYSSRVRHKTIINVAKRKGRR